ncbi:MAG: SCP2 sterol-binding domain-containing protein [Devosia sp.]|nr:SCP2 sterol-binding domain-containing protein [Devosia sp.]
MRGAWVMQRIRARMRSRPLEAFGPALAAVLQPMLDRIVARMAARHPDVFARMGDKARSVVLIDPVDMPLVITLTPDPQRPAARFLPRTRPVRHDAAIRASFLTLLRTIDARADGDALFFSRALTVTGDVEAVVRLRNAIDDVEGSLAQDIAALHGPLGTGALRFLRRRDLRTSK